MVLKGAVWSQSNDHMKYTASDQHMTDFDRSLRYSYQMQTSLVLTCSSSKPLWDLRYLVALVSSPLEVNPTVSPRKLFTLDPDSF